MRTAIATFCFVFLVSVVNCHAGVIRLDRLTDYEGDEFETEDKVIETRFGHIILFDQFGIKSISLPFDLRDEMRIKVTKRVAVYGLTYGKIDYPDIWDSTPPTGDEVINFFSSTTNVVNFTVVLAVNADAMGGGPPMGGSGGSPPPLTLKGFDPIEPQLLPLSSHAVIGFLGSRFDLSVDKKTVGAFVASMNLFDVSDFSGADPDGVVYVATGTMPLNELGMIVPEPASCVVFSVGILSMAVSRLCRRKKESRPVESL